MKRILIVDDQERTPLPVPADWLGDTWTQQEKPLWPKVKRGRQKAGDYTIHGYSTRLRIERKVAPQELLGSLTTDKARFAGQLDRIAEYDLSMVLIEGYLSEFMTFSPKWTPGHDIRTTRARQLAEFERGCAERGILIRWIPPRNVKPTAGARTDVMLAILLAGLIRRLEL